MEKKMPGLSHGAEESTGMNIQRINSNDDEAVFKAVEQFGNVSVMYRETKCKLAGYALHYALSIWKGNQDHAKIKEEGLMAIFGNEIGFDGKTTFPEFLDQFKTMLGVSETK